MRPSLGLAIALCCLYSVGTLNAAPNWSALIPFKRVEADPRKAYSLSEEHGPWLILAANFWGPGAEDQAHELVIELRKRFKWPAYVHRLDFDYTDTVEGLSIDKMGNRARMKYANDSKYEAFAVLVGNYESIDEPAVEKTLHSIKYARPECLDMAKRERTSQVFIGLRELQRRINGDAAKRNKGPMGNAFATRNPLLPEQYFAPDGVDDFVLNLNRRVKHGLLNNSGRYTVQVATFRGNDTINAAEITAIEQSGKLTDKLQVAADKAHRLTEALRRRGVEAYEFHDRHESIVTIGSFDSEGRELADGSIDINPAIYQVMEAYGASKRRLPGRADFGLQPRTLEGIAFDIQPLPIHVPRRSIAMDYVRRLRLFR